jgi:hypothetical protein
LHGFVAQAEEAFGVVKEDDAGGRELNGFRGTIQELGFVGLFELTDDCERNTF